MPQSDRGEEILSKDEEDDARRVDKTRDFLLLIQYGIRKKLEGVVTRNTLLLLFNSMEEIFFSNPASGLMSQWNAIFGGGQTVLDGGKFLV